MQRMFLPLMPLFAVLSACGDDTVDRRAMVEAAMASQDYLVARDHAAAILQDHPADPPALRDLARAQLALGQGQAALGTLQRLEETGHVPPEMRELVAEANLQMGLSEEVLRYMASPETADGWRLRALALEQLERIDDARAAFARGHSASGPQFRLNAAEASHYLRYGQVGLAQAALQRAISEAPESIDVLLVQARIAERENDGARALASYRAILDKAPLDRPAMLGAIEQLLASGEVDEARSLIGRGQEAMPEDLQFTFLAGHLLTLEDDWEGVRQLLQRREGELYQHAPSRTLYARALLELGQPEQARAHLTPLYRAFPEDALIRQTYVRALRATGDGQMADEISASRA